MSSPTSSPESLVIPSPPIKEFFPHPRYQRYEVSRDGIIRHRRHQRQIGIIGNSGYLQIGVYDNTQGGSGRVRNYRAHRFIVEVFVGKIPPGYVIDHIDRNKLNNHVDNLRIVTPSENCRNRSVIRVRVPGTVNSSHASVSTACSSEPVIGKI